MNRVCLRLKRPLTIRLPHLAGSGEGQRRFACNQTGSAINETVDTPSQPAAGKRNSMLASSRANVIDGVQCRPLTINRDSRGCFTEVFCQNWGLQIEPLQWSVVSSHPKVLRGMHFHRRHDEYITIIRGRACVGLYDLRPDSRTRGVSSLIGLEEKNLSCLSFPAGILHGWYFYEASIHLQAVSECYDDYCIDDNLGCHWSDPGLGIAWPDRSPIISPRAASFPPLRELLHALGRKELACEQNS